MFEMRDNRSGEVHTVYAIHKSGPQDVQTKFLVWCGEWKWVWATEYQPAEQETWSPRAVAPLRAS